MNSKADTLRENIKRAKLEMDEAAAELLGLATSKRAEIESVMNKKRNEMTRDDYERMKTLCDEYKVLGGQDMTFHIGIVKEAVDRNEKSANIWERRRAIPGFPAFELRVKSLKKTAGSHVHNRVVEAFCKRYEVADLSVFMEDAVIKILDDIHDPECDEEAPPSSWIEQYKLGVALVNTLIEIRKEVSS